MRTISCEKTVGSSAARVELELRLVEGTVVVGVRTATAGISDIRTGEAAVVTAQTAVGVGKLAEPVLVGYLGEAKLGGIVVTLAFRLKLAGGASLCSTTSVGTEAGVSDDELFAVRSNVAYVLDNLIETAASPAGLEGPLRSDLVGNSEDRLMLPVGLESGIDRRALRGIVGGNAEVLVFDEAETSWNDATSEVRTD